MKIGIGFPAQSVEQTESYVKTAIKYPFESLICYGDLGDQPPYLALGIHAHQLAESDINIVGPLGVPVGRMDPELLGSHARLLEQALGEKALAGIVRGAFLQQINQAPAPLARIEEAIDQIQRQAPQSSIAVGGFGPQILALAKNRGVDYIKLGGSASTKLAQHVTSLLSTTPNENTPKIILGAVTVVGNNRSAARNKARLEVAKYLAVVGKLDPTLDSDQIDSLERFNETYGVTGVDESLISDSLLDAFSYSGTADDIYERIVGYPNDTIDHIQFGTPHGLHASQHGVEILGEITKALKDPK